MSCPPWTTAAALKFAALADHPRYVSAEDLEYGDECPLNVSDRVMLLGTTLYGTVVKTSDADYDHDGERFYQCAWVRASVIWDDGSREDGLCMDELLLNASEVTQHPTYNDLSPLWSGYAIESP